MKTLEYEFHDGSCGVINVKDDGEAMDYIIATDAAGDDFVIKSAWLDGEPFIGECTNDFDG